MLALSLLLIAAHATAAGLPEGSFFVGLKSGAWQMHMVNSGGKVKVIKSDSEPRSATISRSQKKAAYIGADGNVHEVSIADGKDRVLLRFSKEVAYTQPAYLMDGQRLVVVQLKDGSSADTEIVFVGGKANATNQKLTDQPGGQFEPKPLNASRFLYSSNSCSLGCGRIIQEIWSKDLVTGEANQLTLLNSISRQATVSADGQSIYFSSNKGGNYHIWKLVLPADQLSQLTRGAVTDLNPTTDRDGNVYFVRYQPAGVKLLRLDRAGSEETVPMPAGVEDIRDLEIQ